MSRWVEFHDDSSYAEVLLMSTCNHDRVDGTISEKIKEQNVGRTHSVRLQGKLLTESKGISNTSSTDVNSP